MGASTTNLFGKETIHLALIARALAHPARVFILQYIRDNNRMVSCVELSSRLGLSPTTIHHHLGIMQDGGIVELNFAFQSYDVVFIPERIEQFSHFLQD